MAARLTNEMRDEIAAHPGQPVPIVDDQDQKVYYLLEEASLLHLQGLSAEQDAESHRRLKALIQEGMDSPKIPAEEAHARIRKVIQGYADKVT